MKKYKDCYASWTESTIVIGNKSIERRFQWCAQGLVCTATVDKATGSEWRGEEPPAVTPNVTVECAVANNDGLSAKHLLLTATERQGGGIIETKLGVYPQLPFVILERRCKGLHPSSAERVAEKGGTGNENAVVKETVEAATLDRIDNVPLNVRHLK